MDEATKPEVLQAGARRLRLLERRVQTAPLGVRFWDQGFERRVRDGLTVTAVPLGTDRGALSAGRMQAVPNMDGVYVFHRLPGLPEHVASPPGPLVVRRFAVTVADRRERFLPSALIVTLPPTGHTPFLSGLFEGVESAGSPPDQPAPGFYLFSAPTRNVPRTAASVRAQLWDAVLDRPAAYAVLEVGYEDHTWYGVADERGTVLVAFPYPELTGKLAGSPPPENITGLYDHGWDLTVRVRYEGGAEAYLLDNGVPELADVFSQSGGVIFSSEGGAPQDTSAFSLVYGKELVLRTGIQSRLLIGPGSV